MLDLQDSSTIRDFPDNVLAFVYSGRVRKEDYDAVLVVCGSSPAVECK